jgi:hypothetical protein
MLLLVLPFVMLNTDDSAGRGNNNIDTVAAAVSVCCYVCIPFRAASSLLVLLIVMLLLVRLLVRLLLVRMRSCGCCS